MQSRPARAVGYGALLQSVSILTVIGVLPANAQPVAAADVPEQVLITGSLIHGAAAVGVPVSSFGQQDFQDTGAISTGDLFKDVPSVVTYPSFTAIDSGGTTSANQ